MDQDGRDAVFYQLAEKYNWLESKKEKMSFLNEIEAIILPRLSIGAMHRKSLIRKLRRAIVFEPKRNHRGRKPKYNDFDKHHLIQVWKLAGYPCSKRLSAILQEWLSSYNCADSIKQKLITMSPSQMDEFLRQARIDYQRKVSSGTVPAKNHIKKLIRLRDPSVKYTDAGYIESDTVLHCSHYIWGTYANTVSATDLLSSWTLGRGIMGKNAELVVKELQVVRTTLPMKMKSLFFDNVLTH